MAGQMKIAAAKRLFSKNQAGKPKKLPASCKIWINMHYLLLSEDQVAMQDKGGKYGKQRFAAQSR